jgi:peroxiredoxin
MSREKTLVFALTVALLITVQTVHAYTLAPDFSFTDTEGKKHTLSSFRGKVVLLEFFSTSCSVCNNELTQLKTVYNQFPTNFVMISISIDTGHDTSSYVAQWKIAHSIPSGWIMAGYETGGLSAYNYKYNGKFCGRGVPQIYIIDQLGYIRNCHIGTPSSSTLMTEIGKLISSTTPTITVTSPNGGENWVRGTVHTITWSSFGSPGTYVKIELLKSGIVNKIIASSTANDGSYSWTIGTGNLGTDYRIRITSTSNAAITDSSDNNFAITT